LLEEPLPDGPYKGENIGKKALDKMLDHWYELRKWDKNSGIPTREKLEELGLRYVADELESIGSLRKAKNPPS